MMTFQISNNVMYERRLSNRRVFVVWDSVVRLPTMLMYPNVKKISVSINGDDEHVREEMVLHLHQKLPAAPKT